MYGRRNWVLKLSIFFNVIVLLYVATHIVSRNEDLVEVQQPGRNLNSLDVGLLGPIDPADAPIQQPLQQQQQQQPPQPQTVPKTPSPTTVITTKKPSPSPPPVSSTEKTDSPKEESTLEEIIKCHDKPNNPRYAQRGEFWVLYNYVRAKRTFRCFESITYTTHADYTFLDNLEPLLRRWQGPVSLAMFAPGTDFNETLQAIQYLRECGSPLVTQYVTFHIYFSAKHVPKVVPRPDKLFQQSANCSIPPPWETSSGTSTVMYKTKNKLLYPVNVGRNVARDASTTHFILPSDIELYPSPGVIPDFLEMIRKQEGPLTHPNPKVFPLPIFELEKGVVLPKNKTELVRMLKNSTAIPFHKKVCAGCHNVPKSKEWIGAPETQGLHVFHVGKRMNQFLHWEPIFIGTNQEPFYDERLSWEGKSDKMTQGYALCVLDYEFHILDNAFLVHKPGIKTLRKDPQRAVIAGKTNALIKKVIYPELKILYGTKKGCVV